MTAKSDPRRAVGPKRPPGLDEAKSAESVATVSFTEQRFAQILVEALRRVAVDVHLDASQVRRQVYRLVQGALIQERNAPHARRELARVLGPSLDDVDPIPYATVEQARRLAELRGALLRTGAYSTSALGTAKAMTPANARQWIARNRRAGRLFTVAHEGETLVPAFQLDERLEIRPEARPAIVALRDVGEVGWALWAWFGTPSSWLGGRVPAEVLLTEPDVVTEAARQRAAAAA